MICNSNPEPKRGGNAEKILALQFKYFGDAALMTPALRAIREHFPSGELHVLVPDGIAPLLQHLPWVDRVWPMARRRGSTSLSLTWPVIRALRRERFDRSVNFAANDRGAILSLLIGARRRLGWTQGGGFFGRQFCYNERLILEDKMEHESARMMNLLSAWDIKPSSLETEIRADSALAAAAEKLIPGRTILCHVAASQPKKEWPPAHWAEFYQIATAAGLSVAFTTALGGREQSLMTGLKKLAPEAPVLPAIPELPLFLAVVNRAEVFISGDTGPLHFAAGLGVPVIALFGPTPPARWAPAGKRRQILTGAACGCDGGSAACTGASHCLATIPPEKVFAALQTILQTARPMQTS
jgi:lipopolysaccharide heptosyltransferase III